MNALAFEPMATTLVVLKGGVTVPLEALRLAWALEDRGATFAVEGDDPRGSPARDVGQGRSCGHSALAAASDGDRDLSCT